MLIKIIGIFLVMISSTIIGLYYGNKDFFRIKDLEEIKKAFTILLSEIEYSLTPLPIAMENISERVKDPIKEIFINFYEILKVKDGRSIEELWKEAIINNKDICYFNKEDIDYLISFGKILGYLDKNLQINNINISIKYIEEKIENLKETINKNKKMYQSFGILTGLIICIILI